MANVNPGNALELGTAVARASWDAALSSSAQVSAAMAEISKLQNDIVARWTDEALRTQKEMAELASRMLGASTRAFAQSLDQIAVAIQQGAERSALEPPQTAEAGVRRRDKAA